MNTALSIKALKSHRRGVEVRLDHHCQTAPDNAVPVLALDALQSKEGSRCASASTGLRWHGSRARLAVCMRETLRKTGAEQRQHARQLEHTKATGWRRFNDVLVNVPLVRHLYDGQHERSVHVC